MKAIVYRNCGSPDVLRYEDIEKPIPGPDEILVKVRAASLNPLDWKVMSGGPWIARRLFGPRKGKPKQTGVDVAGVVESVGAKITQFKPGDAVFGTCRGAFAEYACISETGSLMKLALAIKPEAMSFENAASAPVAALTALQGLRDRGNIKPGDKVLINGAAGGVGTFAVQIAKSFGAEVTGVCSSRNVDMVRSIGADRVIDYTQEDFTSGGPLYDIFFDCIGNHSLPASRGVLKPKGTYIMIGFPSDASITGMAARLSGAYVLSPFVSQSLGMVLAKANKADLTIIGELIATGKVKPVIDRRYSLREVPEALQYLKEGHARGKVVIDLG